MADKPRWTQKLEEEFVDIMGKGMKVKQFGMQSGKESKHWRSSARAVAWLKENYKKGGRKTRKTKKGGDDEVDPDDLEEMDDDAAIRAWEALGSDVATHFFAENPDVKEEEGWQTTPESKKWLAEYMKTAGERKKTRKSKKTRKNKKSSKKTRLSKKSTRK